MDALGKALFGDIDDLRSDRQIANGIVADDEDDAGDRGNRARACIQLVRRLQDDRGEALVLKNNARSVSRRSCGCGYSIRRSVSPEIGKERCITSRANARSPVSALLETMHNFGPEEKQCGRIVDPEQEQDDEQEGTIQPTVHGQCRDVIAEEMLRHLPEYG